MGPGDREIKLAEVSCSNGAPVRVTKFAFNAEGGWPERADATIRAPPARATRAAPSLATLRAC